MHLFCLHFFGAFISHAVLYTIMDRIGGIRFYLFYKSMFYEERRKKNQVKNYVSKNILQSGMKEINYVMCYVVRVPTMG